MWQVKKARKRHAWWDSQAPSVNLAWLQAALLGIIVFQSARIARGESGWGLAISTVIIATSAVYALMSIATALWLRRTTPRSKPERSDPEPSVWPFSDDESERR